MGILGGFPENNEFGLGSLGWHEEAADGNCNWFQKEIMVATVGALGARTQKSLRFVQAVGRA